MLAYLKCLQIISSLRSQKNQALQNFGNVNYPLLWKLDKNQSCTFQLLVVSAALPTTKYQDGPIKLAAKRPDVEFVKYVYTSKFPKAFHFIREYHINWMFDVSLIFLKQFVSFHSAHTTGWAEWNWTMSVCASLFQRWSIICSQASQHPIKIHIQKAYVESIQKSTRNTNTKTNTVAKTKTQTNSPKDSICAIFF